VWWLFFSFPIWLLLSFPSYYCGTKKNTGYPITKEPQNNINTNSINIVRGSFCYGLPCRYIFTEDCIQGRKKQFFFKRACFSMKTNIAEFRSSKEIDCGVYRSDKYFFYKKKMIKIRWRVYRLVIMDISFPHIKLLFYVCMW